MCGVAVDGAATSVAVNLSARNLLDEDLPRFVLECLGRNKVPTEQFICEITETAVFSRSPIAASVLISCVRPVWVFARRLLHRILVAEFAARARDRRNQNRPLLRHDLGVEPRSTQIVTTLIELAHRCDIIVTAEGIETPEQQNC